MATKKTKTQKTPKCTLASILSGIGDLAVAASILLMSITVYKMVVHLISINKLH